MAKTKTREPEDVVTQETYEFPAEDDRADLLARLAELQAENERLRARAETPAAPPPQRVGDPSLPLWEVTLQCPTPLAFKTLRIHASDGHQAKMEYCRLNGIAAISKNPWVIQPVG